MEVILKEDCKGLGDKNAVVKVRPGYGRNYLIPKGLALVANEANKKVALENSRQAAHKVTQQQQTAVALAAQVEQLTVEVSAKAGEAGKIFGAITTAQLAEALKAQGIVVDRKAICLDKPIKALGMHEVTLLLHKDITPTLKVKVAAAP